MLFPTRKICYTLSVLLKGIIQRTSRNPLFQLLLYDTNITFCKDLHKYRYTIEVMQIITNFSKRVEKEK